MSIAEVLFRASRTVQSRIEQLLALLPQSTVPASLSSEGAKWLVRPEGIDPSGYRVQADRILDGFAELVWHEAEVGFPPRWQVNPMSGHKLPNRFGKHINYRDTECYGDIKYFWVLNRNHQCVALAQAYVLTEDSKYLEALGDLLDSWLQANPAPYGANWTSALEAAIRLINWSATWSLLGGVNSELFQGEAGQLRRDTWLKSIHAHCRFIRHYLSRHSSANNHLLGELSGLYIATATWPFWHKFETYNRFAKKEIERELLKQTTADGVSREQTTFYEHFILEFLLCAGLTGRAANDDFSDAFWHRVEALLTHLASITDAGGNTPPFGDGDDALVLPLCPGQRDAIYSSMLRTGATVFSRPDLEVAGAHAVQTAEWLIENNETNNTRASERRTEFAEGGYYLLGRDFGTHDEILIVADVGQLGYLSIAAHGHADALSFVLSVSGKPILIDPGTYAYQSEQKWRDYFRSTLSHNTVTIDNVSQAEPGGKFMWLTRFSTSCESYTRAENADTLVANHDAYTRLKDPVTHRRKWHLDKQRLTLSVTDELTCEHTHSVQRAWHFAPDIKVSKEDGNIVARTDSSTVILKCNDGEGKLYCGSEAPMLGWVSPKFGEKEPTTSVVFHSEITNNAELQTIFEIVRH